MEIQLQTRKLVKTFFIDLNDKMEEFQQIIHKVNIQNSTNQMKNFMLLLKQLLVINTLEFQKIDFCIFYLISLFLPFQNLISKFIRFNLLVCYLVLNFCKLCPNHEDITIQASLKQRYT